MPLHRLNTDAAITAFLNLYMDGLVFTSGDFPRREHPMMLSIVFESILHEHEAAGIPLTNPGACFELRSKAVGSIISPFTGIEYPLFKTCNLVHDEEWERVAGILDMLIDPSKVRA